MASFEDLPQDVLWLIFQDVIRSALMRSHFYYFTAFEEGTTVFNKFKNDMLQYTQQTKACALINKQSLRLIKKKCIRKDKKHWVFIKGALTNKYIKKK